MIEGIVTLNGVPIVEIECASRLWRAVIDTGFNGELELPGRLQRDVNPQFVGRATSLLAANQRIEEDLYLVDFPFDGRTIKAEASFVDADEILIGTGLLREYRLTVDFPARSVKIDRAGAE